MRVWGYCSCAGNEQLMKKPMKMDQNRFKEQFAAWRGKEWVGELPDT